VEGERKQTAGVALLTAAGLIAAGVVPAAISALGGGRAAAASGPVVKAVDGLPWVRRRSVQAIGGDNIS